jgi:RNA polymerase sigma-70 factor (ECF subfamily)
VIDDETLLLTRWRAGDKRAGSMLFDGHFDAVWRFFAGKVSGDVEDLVQQTFLACVNRRDHIRPELGFRPYLFATARSKLYDHLRKQAQTPEIDGGTVSLVDLGVTPSTILSEREDEIVVMNALRQLPLELQIALELYYFESMRGPALADVLGVPEGTVRSRLRRGLQLLRTKVDELAASPDLRRQTRSTLASWAAALQQDPGSSSELLEEG